MSKDETEKCWLEFDEEGLLVCTYSHALGALCLGNKCRYCSELECVCYKDTTTEGLLELDRKGYEGEQDRLLQKS